MAVNQYYVDGAVGDDGNLGTSPGAGNALATIAAGFLKLTAVNERLWIKSSATYTGTVVSSSYTPVAATPTRVDGYDSTPGDGGIITMDNSGSESYGITSSKSHYIYRNIRMTDFGHTAFNMSSARYCFFDNCHVDNITSRGFYVSSDSQWRDCTATDCGYACIQTTSGATIYNTVMIANSGSTYACKLTSYAHVMNSIIVGGNTAGMYATNQGTVQNCVFDGNGTKRGLYVASGNYSFVLINNIFYDCGEAIYAQNNYPNCNFGYGNLMYSNTTDYTNWSDTDNDITGQDPLFNDPGNNDYTITDASPAVGIGLIDMGGEEKYDSGAYQTPLPSAGGSSRIILTS